MMNRRSAAMVAPIVIIAALIVAVASCYSTAGPQSLFRDQDIVATAAPPTTVSPSPMSTPNPMPTAMRSPQPQVGPGDIAYVSSAGDLMVSNIDGSQVHMLVSGPVARPAWSHDGNSIAFIRQMQVSGLLGEQIEVVQANGAGARVVVPLRNGSINLTRISYDRFPRVRWSPDDKAIYYGWADGRVSGHGLSRLDLKSGVDENLNTFAHDFDIALDSVLVLFVAENAGTRAGNNIYLRSNDLGQRPLQPPNPPTGTGDPTWSPDGMKIATIGERADRSSVLGIINRDGSGARVLASINPFNNSFNGPFLSPALP